MGGWRGRAHTHPGGSPRPGASRGSSKPLSGQPHPSPQKRLSPGVCLRQSGLLGRRTPDHNPPPEEGLMLTRERPYCPRWLAGLSTPPIHPSPPRMASGGYGRPSCWGSPPPATGNNQEQHSRAIGRRLDPGSSPAHGESRMRGSSCITCGHHPSPRAAGSPETGTLHQKQSKHQHINRVGVRVGVEVGEVDGERWLKKTFISTSYRDPLFLFFTSSSATIVDKIH